jgi:hypothetical protein
MDGAIGMEVEMKNKIKYIFSKIFNLFLDNDLADKETRLYFKDENECN